MKTYALGLYWTLIVLPVLSTSVYADRAVDTTGMTGHWEGDAAIIVEWCGQKVLPVSLEITDDGSVSGTIGNAEVRNGRISRNRGLIGRKLNLATDYIISGDLEGAIIDQEGIIRSGFKMPVNFQDGCFRGGVHTTGSKFGGKDRMILSATGLKLKRQIAAPMT